MSAPSTIDVASVMLALLSITFFLALLRLMRGPSLPDRVVALELISFLTAGIMVTYSIVRNESVFLDIAIALALISFLATVAFARYIEESTK